jgi:hypothetical protein
MAVLSLSAGTSSINKISSTFINMRRSLSNTRTVISDTKRVILNRTKIKSEAVFRSKGLFQKRQDNLRKKEAEDQLEASSLGSILSPGFATEKSILNSGKGFLGRILSAIAYLGVGWLLRNLPTWIGMAKEFVARIYKGVAIIKQFFMGAVGFVGNMFNLLGAVAQNIMSFDFFDTSNRVKDTFGQLNQNLSDMSSSIDDALRLMTTSLNEGIASGQNAPPLGTQGESQFSERQSQFPGAGETLSTEQLVAVAKQAGFSQENAVTAAAVAKAESGGRSGVVNDNPRTGDLSYGLWQINMIGSLGPERLKKFGITSYEQLKDPLTNARAAFILSGGSNFNPWSVYKSGKYRTFLPEAQKAANVSPVAYVSGQQSADLQQAPAVSTGTMSLIPQVGPGGFIQGGSGRGETSYATHFHLDYKGANPTAEQLASIREVAFHATKAMLARGSTVFYGNIKQFASGSDDNIRRLIAAEQRAHGGRSSAAVDIQETNPKVKPTFPSQPGSATKFPFAVGAVYYRGGYGREAEIIGTGGVTVSHGASGSTASSVSGVPSMDVASGITPSTSPDVVSVVDTRPQMDLSGLAQLLNAAAASFGSRSLEQESQTTQSPPSSVLNNFIKQKFLTDLAYL